MDTIQMVFTVHDMHMLVDDMRRKGYSVERVPLGYVCHEETKHGKVCVLASARHGDTFRCVLNASYFESGVPQIVTVH